MEFFHENQKLASKTLKMLKIVLKIDKNTKKWHIKYTILILYLLNLWASYKLAKF